MSKIEKCETLLLSEKEKGRIAERAIPILIGLQALKTPLHPMGLPTCDLNSQRMLSTGALLYSLKAKRRLCLIYNLAVECQLAAQT